MAGTTCCFTRTNGTVCGMVALIDQAHCYYHQRERQRLGAVRRSAIKHRNAQATGPAEPYLLRDISEDLFEKLQLPSLDDAASIQVCYSMVLQAALSGQLSRRMAGTLFYGLNLAKQNLDAFRADLREPAHKDAVESDPAPIYSGDPDLDAEHTPIEHQPEYAHYFRKKDSGSQEVSTDEATAMNTDVDDIDVDLANDRRPPTEYRPDDNAGRTPTLHRIADQPNAARPEGPTKVFESPQDDTSVARHVSAGDEAAKMKKSLVGTTQGDDRNPGYSTVSTVRHAANNPRL